MSKISKGLKIGVLAAAIAVIASGSVFATDISKCLRENGLQASQGGDYQIKCGTTSYYAKTQEACAKAGLIATNPDTVCNDNGDLNKIVNTIVNAIIFVIGIVAVIMIILGGISYATSQGDPGKVKKGKDTILYGIIGLVVALLAYAIVNFVLGALQS